MIVTIPGICAWDRGFAIATAGPAIEQFHELWNKFTDASKATAKARPAAGASVRPCGTKRLALADALPLIFLKIR
jgi:hypothetical protein